MRSGRMKRAGPAVLVLDSRRCVRPRPVIGQERVALRRRDGEHIIPGDGGTIRQQTDVPKVGGRARLSALLRYRSHMFPHPPCRQGSISETVSPSLRCNETMWLLSPNVST